MIELIIGAVLLSLLIYGIFIEPHLMKVRHVKIAQKQNLKIAHFTDTHFAWHTTSRRFKKFARNIANEQPDLIIFSGDLFDKVAWAKNRDWTDLLTILSELKAPLGKFAILGNHDFDDEKSSRFVEEFLEKAGFVLLKNSSVVKDNLSISGVDDWREGRPDFELEPIDATFSLLALHEPDTILDMAEKALGLIEDISEIETMVGTNETYQPNPKNFEIYREISPIFIRLSRSLLAEYENIANFQRKFEEEK